MATDAEKAQAVFNYMRAYYAEREAMAVWREAAQLTREAHAEFERLCPKKRRR